MGRHAVPGVPPDPVTPTDHGPNLTARAVLALTAGAATALATAWAGRPWSVAGIVGLGAAVVVLLAAWIAGTLPSAPPDTAQPRGTGRRPAGSPSHNDHVTGNPYSGARDRHPRE